MLACAGDDSHTPSSDAKTGMPAAEICDRRAGVGAALRPYSHSPTTMKHVHRLSPGAMRAALAHTVAFPCASSVIAFVSSRYRIANRGFPRFADHTLHELRIFITEARNRVPEHQQTISGAHPIAPPRGRASSASRWWRGANSCHTEFLRAHCTIVRR